MDLGIDRLSWEITDHPENAYSRRFLPGTPAFEAIRQEIWDTSNLGNAIPGATPRATIDVKQLFGSRPLKARSAKRILVKTRVQNACKRPFPAQASYGRRLVRLGAQLCAPDGTLINRDYERAWLPSHLQAGATVEIPITVKAPETPGRYRLKFDLVSEGIDWFEQTGSPTTTRELVVR